LEDRRAAARNANISTVGANLDTRLSIIASCSLDGCPPPCHNSDNSD
jgi:hypothetical protein